MIIEHIILKILGGNKPCSYPLWPLGENMIWIGGQTKNSSQCGDPYVWKPLKGIDIPFNYTNWNRQYLDCFQGAENCAQIATGLNYSWNDDNCARFSCAICELHV